MRTLTELDEKEILALAISSEEEDGRIYADFAESLRDQYPDSARGNRGKIPGQPAFQAG